jgi:hypothetical protein
MDSDVVEALEHPDTRRSDTPPKPTRRYRWVFVALAAAVLVAALAMLADNEVRSNTRFDSVHRSLTLARHQREFVLAVLQFTRHELQTDLTLTTQSNASLADDAEQLRSVQATLQNDQAGVTRQGSSITALQSCLGGVQEALNALSVGDPKSALVAVTAVSAPCQQAVATDG